MKTLIVTVNNRNYFSLLFVLPPQYYFFLLTLLPGCGFQTCGLSGAFLCTPSQSSVNVYTCATRLFRYTVEALWAYTLVSGQLYLWPPRQTSVWNLAHTNYVFTNSRKRPAPVADTFCFPRVSAYRSFDCIRRSRSVPEFIYLCTHCVPMFIFCSSFLGFVLSFSLWRFVNILYDISIS